MEIELNKKLQARLQNLAQQKAMIEQHMNNEVNIMLDALEVDVEQGKTVEISQDFTKLIIHD